MWVTIPALPRQRNPGKKEGKRRNGSLFCLGMSNPRHPLTFISRVSFKASLGSLPVPHQAGATRPGLFWELCLAFQGHDPCSLSLSASQASPSPGPSQSLGWQLISKADKASHSYCPVAVCIFEPFPSPAPIGSSELQLKAQKLNFELNKRHPTPPSPSNLYWNTL